MRPSGGTVRQFRKTNIRKHKRHTAFILDPNLREVARGCARLCKVVRGCAVFYVVE